MRLNLLISTVIFFGRLNELVLNAFEFQAIALNSNAVTLILRKRFPAGNVTSHFDFK